MPILSLVRASVRTLISSRHDSARLRCSFYSLMRFLITTAMSSVDKLHDMVLLPAASGGSIHSSDCDMALEMTIVLDAEVGEMLAVETALVIVLS